MTEPTEKRPEGMRPIAGLHLGTRQRAALAAAITIVSGIVILGALFAIGWVLTQFLHRFSNVFLPLAVAGVIAMLLAPYYHWLRRRLKFPAALAVATVFLSISLPIAGFGWFFGAVMVEQISDMVIRFPAWRESMAEDLQARWPQMKHFLDENPWGQRAREVLEAQQETVINGLRELSTRALTAGMGVFGFLGTLAAWAVMPVYLAYFLIAGARVPRDLEKLFPFLKPTTRKDLVYLINEFVAILVAFFRGQFVIAFLQGLLYAIGFSVVGLRYGFILGMMLGLLNIIPYLGNIVGLAICLPLAYFQADGGVLLLGLIAIIFVIVQLIEGYVLTPRIMGSQTGLHPVAIIVALFFWGTALQGILGMILAIPLTAFLVVFWRLARRRYIKELI
ncbi:MAG: AI-2E family transporter [Acidobacteriota bacterium]|nr:AI-2E family transporter [Acidobacteriota bacterium]MDH3785243.1 AI-2E family transporter [Acidobacteriota bacterium]